MIIKFYLFQQMEGRRGTHDIQMQKIQMLGGNLYELLCIGAKIISGL